jgi:thymidylate synthase
MKKLLLIFLLIAAWSVQAREVYPLCDDWLFSFRYEDFELEGYDPWPHIAATVSV